MTRSMRNAALGVLVVLGSGCAATTAREPANPNATAGAPAGQAAPAARSPGYTEADVRFMQQMIHHHAQALEMAALVPTHTSRRDLHIMAERIAVSQRDEIAIMQQWLRRHGQMVPDPDSMMSMPGHEQHAGGHAAAADTIPMMPGMLTPAQMRRLRESQGPAFDRLFLELMIQHHEGAIRMVERLFVTPGAAQEPDVFRIASDINADQSDEIRRMRSMLAAMRE